MLILWYSMLSREKCLGFEPRCGVVCALCSVLSREKCAGLSQGVVL